MDQQRSDLLARLAAQCSTCRVILAKVRRRLPIDKLDKQHLIEEMHFMHWAERIIDGRRTSWKPGRRL